MSISRREKVMIAVTVGVVVFGVVGTQFSVQRQKIFDARNKLKTSKNERAVQVETIAAAPGWVERYGKVQHMMPVFPVGQHVSTYWGTRMSIAAERHGVVLSRQRATAENFESDVYQFPIEVGEWEGTLEAFVGFMLELQSEGAMLRVREMRVQPDARRPGIFRGSFTLDCAYMRGEVASATASSASAAVVAAAAAPQTAKTASPTNTTETVSAPQENNPPATANKPEEEEDEAAE